MSLLVFAVLGVCSVEPSGAVEPGLADVMADRLATHDKASVGVRLTVWT
jgi:hypothetical protein